MVLDNACSIKQGKSRAFSKTVYNNAILPKQCTELNAMNHLYET